MDYTAAKYGYRPEHKQDFHNYKLTETEFKLLAPLLESQDYINKVIATDNKEEPVTYDLDKFRGVLWRSFVGNYVEAYYKTFDVPYTAQDIITPWLVVPEVKQIAPIIIARTLRHRDANSNFRWQQYVSLDDFDKMAIFIGLDEEYDDFVNTFCTPNRKPHHFKPKDFLEMAQVIAGATYTISNGTFVYALAQGLGKNTILETLKDRTLANNECYFNRKDCDYF